MFSLGEDTGDQELYEPLERLRNVVRNVDAALQIYLPKHCYQRRLRAFVLPNPHGDKKRWRHVSDSRLGRLKQTVQDCLNELMKMTGIDVNVGFQEWLKLLPFAEGHHSSGVSWRAAWATASADFPEFSVGRLVVQLFVGALHQTSNVERTFGDVALHEARQRAALQGRTLETLLLARQGPPVEKLAKKERDAAGLVVLTPRPTAIAILRAYVAKYSLERRPNVCRQRKRRRDAGVTVSPDTQKKKTRRAGNPTARAGSLAGS